MFCCSAGVLPAIWRSKREVRFTLTDTKEKTEKDSGIYLKTSEKNNDDNNEHSVAEYSNILEAERLYK